MTANMRTAWSIYTKGIMGSEESSKQLLMRNIREWLNNDMIWGWRDIIVHTSYTQITAPLKES